MTSIKENIWFAVVNPQAGSGKTISLWPKAEDYLREYGIKYEYKTTWRKCHATEITIEACESGYRRFLAVGGDGTLHEVLDGIMHFIDHCKMTDTFENTHTNISLEDFYLTVIPVGSGNDWIRTLNLPNDSKEIVERISKSKFGKQDVFKLTMLTEDKEGEKISYMANISGVGFDADVCKAVNFEKEHGKSGKILYVKALVKNLIKHKTYKARVYADDELVYEGDVISIAMGIGKYSGGGMRQVPDALVDDGLLDYTIIPNLNIFQILKAAPDLFTDKFTRNNKLISSRCTKFRVETEKYSHQAVEVDGEVVGVSPVQVEKCDGQLNIVIG